MSHIGAYSNVLGPEDWKILDDILEAACGLRNICRGSPAAADLAFRIVKKYEAGVREKDRLIRALSEAE